MNTYETMTPDELDKEALDYFYRHRENGSSSEFDPSINDISRARIAAYYKQHGQCFLIKINDYNCDRRNPQITYTPYTGQLIYNFEFSLALPVEDEQLRELIVEQNREHPTLSGLTERVKAIFERVEVLHGITLHWA